MDLSRLHSQISSSLKAAGVFLMYVPPGPSHQLEVVHHSVWNEVLAQGQKVLLKDFVPGPEKETCLWRDVWTPFFPLPSCQLCHLSVSPAPQYLLSPYMGDICQAHLTFISIGSKNPKIALKLAEFQTDSQGKVRGSESLEELLDEKRVRVSVLSWVGSWVASAGCSPPSHGRCSSWPTECKTTPSRALLPGWALLPLSLFTSLLNDKRPSSLRELLLRPS